MPDAFEILVRNIDNIKPGPVLRLVVGRMAPQVLDPNQYGAGFIFTGLEFQGKLEDAILGYGL
jgi:hypothetical protein